MCQVIGAEGKRLKQREQGGCGARPHNTQGRGAPGGAGVVWRLAARRRMCCAAAEGGWDEGVAVVAGLVLHAAAGRRGRLAMNTTIIFTRRRAASDWGRAGAQACVAPRCTAPCVCSRQRACQIWLPAREQGAGPRVVRLRSSGQPWAVTRAASSAARRSAQHSPPQRLGVPTRNPETSINPRILLPPGIRPPSRQAPGCGPCQRSPGPSSSRSRPHTARGEPQGASKSFWGAAACAASGAARASRRAVLRVLRRRCRLRPPPPRIQLHHGQAHAGGGNSL